MTVLEFVPAQREHLDAVHRLEEVSYHPDEAASREQLASRIEYALRDDGNLFLVGLDGPEIAAFVCSTVSNAPLVTDESMKTHVPGGTTVCLHSVCVSPTRRRQGLASAILKAWIAAIRQNAQYKRLALISRPNLIPLYESVGFRLLGKSEVVHGPDPWFDCVIDL
ncbi:acyl-CoA N-acyltransferase [Syncephalastrum racemosum]|uniref:Acyl-CoA N-acyltransferase n=1 Tax=Syncephalastrum racemosum TaxID=13706 RepID=A0A1X2HI97_SYNRA|nr:acyl-CoA N-acyltransferase [Syncephalastrum racemosum]